MHTQRLALASLLPTQTEVLVPYVQSYSDALATGETVLPIRTIAFPTDESRRYIVFDGHSRSRAAVRIGRSAVEGIVYNDDEAFRTYLHDHMSRSRLLRMILERMPLREYTRDQYRTDYKNIWRPTVRGYGVRTMQDVRIVAPGSAR